MKKVIPLILLSSLALCTLIIFNLFKTQDRIRVLNIEQTQNSYRFYIKDSGNISLHSELAFLKQLSQEEHVSIFKTDTVSENTVLKSVVYDYSSFPYASFGLTKHQLFKQDDTVYKNKTNIISRDNDANSIPTFMSSQNIKLQTLDTTYHDNSMSIVGSYTVVYTKDNKDQVLDRIANFFGESKTSIQTPQSQEKIGFVNYTLMIMVAIIFGMLIILFSINLISPLKNIRIIGIKKLHGWSNISIFWDVIAANLCLITVASLLIDFGTFLLLPYHPNLLFISLAVCQVIIVMIYLLSNLLLYVSIKRITINRLLKHFVNFKIGVLSTYAMKSMIMLSTMGILLLIGANINSLVKNYQLNVGWREHRDMLIQESFQTKGAAASQDATNNNEKNQQRFYAIFKQLEKTTNAQYIHAEQIIPHTDYYLSQSQDANIYRPSDHYNVIHANINFLKSTPLKNLNLNYDGNTRTFLVPEKYKSQHKKIKRLVQNIIFSGENESQQSRTNPNNISVNIVYYSQSVSVFPYDISIKGKIKNPIVSVFNQNNISYSEKAQLSNTGLSDSPIKIKGTKYNIDAVNSAVNKQSGKNIVIPKFTRVGSLLNDRIDTDVNAIKVLTFVIISLLALNIFGSFFLTDAVIQSQKQVLAVKKIHGYKLIDRFKFEFIGFISIYAVQVIILSVFSKYWLVVPILGVLFIIDFIITTIFIVQFETKNLNNILRGE